MQEGVDGADGAGGASGELSDEQLALDMLSLEDVAPPLPELVIPKSLVAELVHALRESCIRELASKGVQRRGAVHAQCEDRKAKLTEQLEERLRQHWPRKGRIEVKAHQPRGDELRKHQARYLRHVRKVRDILRKQGESLASLEQQAREHSAEYLSAVQVLDARIPRMRKLTALQGVLRKGMQARTDFAHEVEAYREQLECPAVHEPRALLDDNALFLRGCHTFATGGDYDTGEIQIAQDKLLEVDSEINDAIRVRQKRVAKIVKEQDEAITAFSALETTYQRVRLELSMREGLGHKYGAPRRGVQEQLRTETTKSSAAESAIVENISSLERACPHSPFFLIALFVRPMPCRRAQSGGAARSLLTCLYSGASLLRLPLPIPSHQAYAPRHSSYPAPRLPPLSSPRSRRRPWRGARRSWRRRRRLRRTSLGR